MNPETILLFLQNLYSNNSGQNLVFEQRETQITSPTLSRDEAQKVFDILKKILPSLARLGLVESRQEKGKFRAVIFNPKDIFAAYANEIKDLLNQNHPIPNIGDGTTYSWVINACGDVRYKTNILSLEFIFADERDAIRANSIKQIEAYNSHLQRLYPKLQITIENPRHGNAYKIDNLTYENYQALCNRRNLGTLFFKRNEPHEIKDDIESHLMNPETILLFLQNLYSNNSGQNLVFEQRETQITSPALNRHAARKVCDNLKDYLPNIARVGLVESREEIGKFRAVIGNPKEIFAEYANKIKDLLNQYHPNTDIVSGRTICSWEFKCGKIGYSTIIDASAFFLSNKEAEAIRGNSIKQAEGYNNYLQTLYPKLQITTLAVHTLGNVYVINNLTYENYQALCRVPYLGMSKNEPKHYDMLPHEMKDNIESHQFRSK